jgi:hypothetical protein
MTPAVLLLLAAAILLMLSGIIAALVWWVRRPAAVPRESEDPLPLFSNTLGAVWRDRQPAAQQASAASGAFTGDAHTGDAHTGDAHTGNAHTGNAHTGDTLGAPDSEESAEAAPTVREPAVAVEARTGEFPYAYSPGFPVTEGDIVRFARPSDRSLQWLPGSLDVLNGPDVGRTIRFVHVPHTEDDVISFGRSSGPAYRHVQLRDGLVNRRHARLVYEDGQWLIINLSEERPVLRNDTPLPVEHAQSLQDGDRLTMGATLFRFRA